MPTVTYVKPLWFNPTAAIPAPQEMDPTLHGISLPKLAVTGDGSGVGIDLGGQRVANAATPTAANDLVTKAYADGISSGMVAKMAVKAVSTANVASLSGLPTIDGLTLADGDRALLTAQSNAVQNGPWVVHSGAWNRPSDFVAGYDASGDLFPVASGGTMYGKSLWACVTPSGSAVVDTNSLSFTEFAGPYAWTAGNGIVITGTSVAAKLASSSGLQFTGGAIDTQLVSGGGLQKGASGLSLQLAADNNLTVDGNGLRVAGVPALFTIAGTATAATVTAANLGTLTAGAASDASALHTHQLVTSAKTQQYTLSNGSTALSLGDPVYLSPTNNTVGRADASIGASTGVFALAAAGIAANAAGNFISHGPLPGALSGATPGGAVYLKSGGGLTQSVPGAGLNVVLVGYAINATDLFVVPPQAIVKRV